MSATTLTLDNLDDIGIVAGLVDELGLVEYLNEQAGVDSRESISIGVVVKANDSQWVGLCQRSPILV